MTDAAVLESPTVAVLTLSDYIRDCYRRNINPLPQLRKVYPQNEWRYLSRLDLAAGDKCKASDGWVPFIDIYTDPADPQGRTTRVYVRVKPTEPETTTQVEHSEVPE